MEYPFVYAPGIAQYIISLHIGSMKFGQILALWVLTCPPPNPNPNPNANPKPPSPENWNLGRSWHFGFWLGRTHSPPPPPGNWNLVRSWRFEFWRLEYV